VFRGVTSGSRVAGLSGGQACKVTLGFSIKSGWVVVSRETGWGGSSGTGGQSSGEGTGQWWVF
jgi:hypothetical protein